MERITVSQITVSYPVRLTGNRFDININPSRANLRKLPFHNESGVLPIESHHRGLLSCKHALIDYV
ncbi:hypothetical protein Pan110_38880 [Gimesia panareensis]|nr:hypothetical protein Pan110_38880 [Gimesia panareensis]